MGLSGGCGARRERGHGLHSRLRGGPAGCPACRTSCAGSCAVLRWCTVGCTNGCALQAFFFTKDGNLGIQSESQEITGHGTLRNLGGSGGRPEKIVVPVLVSDFHWLLHEFAALRRNYLHVLSNFSAPQRSEFQLHKVFPGCDLKESDGKLLLKKRDGGRDDVSCRTLQTGTFARASHGTRAAAQSVPAGGPVPPSNANARVFALRAWRPSPRATGLPPTALENRRTMASCASLSAARAIASGNSWM